MYEFVDCRNALDLPGDVIRQHNGVTLEKHLIPWDHVRAKVVYFVSGDNGDEFGQFPTKDKASETFSKMSQLSLKERRIFDE